MQHLIRVNLVVYVGALVASSVTLYLVGTPLWRSLLLAASAAGVLQLISLTIIFFAWKWIPGFKFLVFPNLSGNWIGRIRYYRQGQNGELDATLNIEQNVSVISLVLLTDRAESETLVVYPRRLSNRRLELLYVYETRSREGQPPPFYRYRGTAVMRVEGNAERLSGTYYTEQGGLGTVFFQRNSA
jgi:hypothetical protein